ncbi:MAG: hypothetical protein PF961_19405 [Planctomycetota bacterium]|jgi:pimeloyl-ACP methyl ester carboxylesterase|nr:hypothetical protein [Planctomycetota bacterium]
MIEAPFFPIVFVSPAAAAPNDPFLGFNAATLHSQGHLAPYQGMVLSLIHEHGYTPSYLAEVASGDRSLWFHADTSGALRDRAEALEAYLAQICAATCSDDPVAREGFKVILIGHGAGALTARACAQDTELVDKLVLLGWDHHDDDPADARYALGFDGTAPLNHTNQRYDCDRALCIYGAQSGRACLSDAASAAVSGSDAELPSSAAAYRCTERFLFGDVRVDLRLVLEDCEAPKGAENATTSFVLESTIALRGAPRPLQQRCTATGTAGCASLDQLKRGRSLGSVFLANAGRVQRRRQGLGFGLDLRLIAHHRDEGAPYRDEFFANQALWADGLQIDVVGDSGSFKLLYRFASAAGRKSCEVTIDSLAGCSRASIPIERKASPKCTGRVELVIQHWNKPEGDYLVLVNG